jgi:hypothetical protein
MKTWSLKSLSSLGSGLRRPNSDGLGLRRRSLKLLDEQNLYYPQAAKYASEWVGTVPPTVTKVENPTLLDAASIALDAGRPRCWPTTKASVKPEAFVVSGLSQWPSLASRKRFVPNSLPIRSGSAAYGILFVSVGGWLSLEIALPTETIFLGDLVKIAPEHRWQSYSGNSLAEAYCLLQSTS